MTRCRSVSIRSVTSNCTSVGRKTCDTVTPDTAFNLELLSGSLQCKCHRSQDVLRQQLVIKGHEKMVLTCSDDVFSELKPKSFHYVSLPFGAAGVLRPSQKLAGLGWWWDLLQVGIATSSDHKVCQGIHNDTCKLIPTEPQSFHLHFQALVTKTGKLGKGKSLINKRWQIAGVFVTGCHQRDFGSKQLTQGIQGTWYFHINSFI